MNFRTLLKAGCVLGVLICLVAVIAPSAYGNGIVEGTTEAVSVDVTDVPDTSDVTQVTEAVPEVEQVTTQVEETTTPVTQTAEQVTSSPPDAPEVDATSVPSPTTTSVQTSTTVAAPSTSGSAAVPGDPGGSDASSSGDVSLSTADSSSGGASSGPSDTSTGATTGGGSAYTNTPAVAASPQQARMPTFSTNAFGSFRGPQVAAAGGKPGDILDDLLDIGNSIGVDQVKGLQITNARGDAESAAPSSGSEESSSAPAPLALTGIAIGAFLAIGSLLVLAGNGARSAGRVSAA